MNPFRSGTWNIFAPNTVAELLERFQLGTVKHN